MPIRRPERLVVINDRSTPVGGASNLAILSAQLADHAGIPVTFFAGDGRGETVPVADTIHAGGIPLMESSRAAAFASGLYNFRAAASLRHLIARHDTPSTIYHVHGWSKILSPSIFRALSSVRERTILHAHDYFLACPNGGYVNFRTHAVCALEPMSRACVATRCDKRGYHEKLWRVARHTLREFLFPTRAEPATIAVVHDSMRFWFESAGTDCSRMETIRNPVTPLLAAPSEPWTVSEFFFIGRLEPEKGFEDAARAARLAGVPLHVVGDGSGRADLERKYPEVVIHGWKTHAEMAGLLNAARAVVVSSRVPEPFGLAALESATSGIPVILPDGALLARELTACGAGLSYRSGDFADLARAMRTIGESDALVRRMQSSALRSASALAHTRESWGEALMTLYGKVLARAEVSPAKSDARGLRRLSTSAIQTGGKPVGIFE
jgi:glycosyltransferase involved in cell wall biosynthesis